MFLEASTRQAGSGGRNVLVASTGAVTGLDLGTTGRNKWPRLIPAIKEDAAQTNKGPDADECARDPGGDLASSPPQR